MKDNKNTKEEAITLSEKINSLISSKRGVLELTFYDDSTISIKLFKMESKIDETNFYCTLYTISNDINEIEEYDIYFLKDVN